VCGLWGTTEQYRGQGARVGAGWRLPGTISPGGLECWPVGQRPGPDGTGRAMLRHMPDRGTETPKTAQRSACSSEPNVAPCIRNTDLWEWAKGRWGWTGRRGFICFFCQSTGPGRTRWAVSRAHPGSAGEVPSRGLRGPGGRVTADGKNDLGPIITFGQPALRMASLKQRRQAGGIGVGRGQWG